MEDDQATDPTHQTGTRKGEEMARNEEEAGREEGGTTQTGRRTGGATARFSTGINSDAEEPIDPESPEIPPG